MLRTDFGIKRAGRLLFTGVEDTGLKTAFFLLLLQKPLGPYGIHA